MPSSPVEKKSLTEPEHAVFGGNGPCPKCKTIIWVEWLNTAVTMACPKCEFRFDHHQAMAFLSAHDPGDNYKAGEAAPAVEAVGILERAKALLARQEQTAGSSSGESTTSRPAARPIPPEQGTGSKVGGIVAGFWNWLTKYKCPNCRSRKTSVLSNSMTDKRQVVKTNHAKDHRPQEVFNVATFESKIRCNDCIHEWIHEYELESPA
jgi:DNA-directed RNA polymerase subunit RPC12/RpoP